MRRDTLNTVTGWKTLDKLTLPFWAVYCRYQKWRLYRHIGHGDTRQGEAIFKEALNHSLYNPITEAQRILEENR